MPALAQDLGGLRMTLGVDQRFEAGDNLSLKTPSAGSTTISTTRLSFGVFSETRTQKFAFTAGGAYRAGNVENGVSTGFVEPRVGLSYDRIGANSRFFISGNYFSNDVSFLRPLSDFTDANGVVILPPDFEGLNGTGIRQSSTLRTRFETGLQDPLGFEFFVNANSTSYDNVSSTSLNDYERIGGGAKVILRFSPVTKGTFGLNGNRFTADDAVNTNRRTTAVNAGLDHEVSPVTTLESSIGYSKTDTEKSGVTTSREGIIGSLGLVRDMTNGTAFTSLNVNQNQFGQRTTFRVGRDMMLPDGALGFNIGVTNGEDFPTQVIGGLNWQKELPTGEVHARINRNVGLNSEDDERIQTLASVGYSHTINRISSIGLDMSYGATEFDTANDVNRTDISLSYRHSLTQDWFLRTGVRYTTRDEQTVGQAKASSVFLSLSRDFELLH